MAKPERRFLGVYSTADAVGRSRSPSGLWCVWEAAQGLAAQALDANLALVGMEKGIPREELESRFTLERGFSMDAGTGRIRRVWSKDAPDQAGREEERDESRNEADTVELDAILETRQEDARRRTAPTSAGQVGGSPAGEELKAAGAARAPSRAPVRLDVEAAPHDLERAARTDFILALAELKRGNRGKASRMFESLAAMEGAFEPGHKHLFNEFGIGLRKNRIYPVAIKHYERALALSPRDENLYHNMARAYYEQGDMARAVICLRKSLELNPGLRESTLFLEYIKQRQAGGKAE